MTRRIIVFGVSGVGKTDACQAFVEHNPSFIHIGAGELLAKNLARSREALRLSSRVDVEANQRALVALVEEAAKGRDFIMDAHAVIDNGNEMIAVPDDVIFALAPNSIVLLEASAEAILRRRAMAHKVRPVLPLERLESQTIATRLAVERYASFLAVPLAIIDLTSRRLDPPWLLSSLD